MAYAASFPQQLSGLIFAVAAHCGTEAARDLEREFGYLPGPVRWSLIIEPMFWAYAYAASHVAERQALSDEDVAAILTSISGTVSELLATIYSELQLDDPAQVAREARVKDMWNRFAPIKVERYLATVPSGGHAPTTADAVFLVSQLREALSSSTMGILDDELRIIADRIIQEFGARHREICDASSTERSGT